MELETHKCEHDDPTSVTLYEFTTADTWIPEPMLVSTLAPLFKCELEGSTQDWKGTEPLVVQWNEEITLGEQPNPNPDPEAGHV